MPPPTGVVLIVDDNQDDRDHLAGLLADFGYPTRSASSGSECLDLIESWDQEMPLSAVILDLVMPVLNGFEVLQELRKQTELGTVPVVLVGSGDAELSAECLACGANALLEKPVDREALAAALALPPVEKPPF